MSFELNPDGQVDVVMALYGGFDNHFSRYNDVTARVESLLKKPEGLAELCVRLRSG
jgi:hypothetical protein